MKKIIIVGHNQDNCEKLESLFHHFGMKQALPSRREGLTPIQIGELLTKVVKMQEQQFGAQKDSEIQLLSEKLPTHIRKRQAKKHLKKKLNTHTSISTPKSTWDYIPMDLLIANIDNEFWGWADKNALDHLDYWTKIDPSILFVLTYDHPSTLLVNLDKSELLIDSKTIFEHLNDWENYNKKLLSFYEKNPDNVILVNSSRVYQHNQNTLTAIRSRIISDMEETNSHELVLEIESGEVEEISPINNIIINTILHHKESAVETYLSLQNKAHFPCVDKSYELNIDSYVDAWNENKSKDVIIKNSSKENEGLVRDINNKIQENKKLESEIEKGKKEICTLNNILNERETEYKELSTQINHTQIKLDEFNNLNIELKKELTKEKNESKSLSIGLNEAQKKLSEYGKVNQELKDKLVKNQQDSNNETQELVAQLHSVQMQLEKQYKYNKELIDSPPIYGAEDRIKYHLKYRVGNILLKNGDSFTGWCKMPFSLMYAYAEFRINYSDRQSRILPRIEEYQDYEKAIKVKQGVSYQLGTLFLENLSKPMRWFSLPFMIKKEIKKSK